MALHLEIILESELQILIDLIQTTQNHNTYVQYGVYIESCTKRLAELSSNDLLFSGILDVDALDTSNSPIKKALQETRLWDNVKETLLPKLLPDSLKKFIINQVRAGNALIPDDGDCLLYQKTQNLIDSISKLSKCGKDALDFVINNYAKSHNYDLVKMQEIKVYLLHAHETVLELFIIDRRIVPLYRIRRLGIVKIPFLNNSVNKLIKLIQFLYTFSIHIEENLRLIKEIFNENLDKDHISNYSSEDNNRNEEKDIYNDEGEEECEEISSKMFAFIPTYYTPRSSINKNY
ncbi:25050_t:CDS:2 [Gigaspora margarita]|uniref:25050_t:CDS:1 n=1 Tax=Gigaspora margarita TaxID=4874 RepID=A0ABM8VXD5_GIGMA|nr:25050_t:CDS:2 [Gigaspora margarita]